MLEKLQDVLLDSLEITGWVMLMMTLIEIINVSSSGKWMERFRHRPYLQIVIASLLCAIPGCAGGFAVVSMFTHNIISFGAFIAGMTATFGDEAFYLFAQSPKWGVILTAVLFGIALAMGALFQFLGRKWHFALEPHRFEIHENEDCHRHSDNDTAGMNRKRKLQHFLKEHVWHHVIKHHLLQVFLWSFGVLAVLAVVGFFVDIESLMRSDSSVKYLMLLFAVLVGFIPESGPNLIFIALFLDHSIPFGILLANSISQNGHAGLPLLAQSRKNFLIMKTITMLAGLLIGGILISI